MLTLRDLAGCVLMLGGMLVSQFVGRKASIKAEQKPA